MHHDTKISNVLFDNNCKGVCVIDLDTLMPGFFFSDIGDIMRTYLSAAGEEENGLEKIEVREDFYRAISKGYGKAMHNKFSDYENDHIPCRCCNDLYAGTAFSHRLLHG